MSRLWEKGAEFDELVLSFTVADDYLWDERLVKYDVRASIAHVNMLASCGHIKQEIADSICQGLYEVGDEFEAGLWHISQEDEDCHTAIENRLVQKLGEDGKRVHLARSRNDQVLVAIRLYLKSAANVLAEAAESVSKSLDSICDRHGNAPMPGYTHMQRAMPSTIRDWAMGYQAELVDDAVEVRQSIRRADLNPLGSAAGYGTPGIQLDRDHTTRELGFAATQVPATGVQLSRGKAEASLAFALTILLQDIGKLATDLCLFTTSEFGFAKLPAKITTGSSVMPQKRNPDVFELVRGKSAQAMSELVSILAVTSKMPSGYHRDFQLVKPPLFRLIDTAWQCCAIMSHVLPQISFDEQRCAECMDAGLYAAERAFELVQSEGIPFRDAYARVASELANS